MTLLNNEQLDLLAQDDYLVWDNVFDLNMAKGLLQEAKHWENEEAFKEAGIGKLENHIIKENFRSDKIKWISKTDCLPYTAKYLTFLKQIQNQFKQEFYLSLKDFESMYAIYPSGSFYKKHTDQFVQQPHRIISLVYYMNENWQETNGGQLLVYKEDKSFLVQPIFNRLVMFKSALWHEVLPCTQKRYSITTWMKDQLNDVYFL